MENQDTTVNEFDVVSTPINKGVTLLEASAGTGKTFALAMLVLRLVVEEARLLENILVVTFTKAATEELKTRIRNRLATAQKALTSAEGTPELDEKLTQWLIHVQLTLKLPKIKIQQRLNQALLDIDRAAIFTIHGFCQRVLREHALESGQLFNVELSANIDAIKQACADDFWRKQMYERSVFEVGLLTSHFKTPDALLNSVKRFPAAAFSAHTPLQVTPDFQQHHDINKQLALIKELAENVAVEFYSCFDKIKTALVDSKDSFKSTYDTEFTTYAPMLQAWIEGEHAQLPPAKAFTLFTSSSIKEGLNGNKFRANKNQQSDERKQVFIEQLALNNTLLTQLNTAKLALSLTFRCALLETLRLELTQRGKELNVLSFDDLIIRLAEALKSEKAANLTQALRTRFTAALIDEFQDTDDDQWFIFSTLFNCDTHELFLIGDPKQAIYKFRGADIYSYLAAQKTAKQRYTLGENWRSHPELVAAVNSLFKRDNVFCLTDLIFKPVRPAKSATEAYLSLAGKPIKPLQLWQLNQCSDKKSYWSSAEADPQIQQAVVNEIVRLLTEDVTLQPANIRLQPSDIAILVKSNNQANAYQQALLATGVPALINSNESVFTSPEAEALLTILHAVVKPNDLGLLRQALSCAWYGMDGQALYQLFNHDIAMDNYLLEFAEYHQNWLQQGVLAMMMKLLTHPKIIAHLPKCRAAERVITNIYHLIELLQQAVHEEYLGLNKTVQWLESRIIEAKESKDCDEHHVLRLESDANAVQIITMHRAKGLEYPVVFCPYLWQSNDTKINSLTVVSCHQDNYQLIDIGSTDFAQHQQMAIQESRAEAIRIAYVALTRAKYLNYVIWADVHNKDTVNESALASLINLSELSFNEQLDTLSVLGSTAGISHTLIDIPVVATARYHSPVNNTQTLTALTRHRVLYTTWQMSSYTSLANTRIQDAPEFANDSSDDDLTNAMQDNSPTANQQNSLWENIPKGSKLGNVVHRLLESHRYAEVALANINSEECKQLCQQYGVELMAPELLATCLQSLVHTPLSATEPSFCLKNLEEVKCLKELAFYLSLPKLNVAQINTVLAFCPVYRALPNKQLSGYLTGFIDLVCEYQGQYYVMDYKTNTLPDYTEQRLQQAMRHHNYGLQYWLYTIVLHRYLQQRLDGYDYERHFGGVRYLFVRGMIADQPLSGVYQDRPAREKVEELAALFN